MNFDLKTLELTAAATEKCDLLVVLVPEGFRPGQDALSVLAAHALKCGDLKAKAGTHLQLYLAPAVSARRVVLLGAGNQAGGLQCQGWQAPAVLWDLGSGCKARGVSRNG